MLGTISSRQVLAIFLGGPDGSFGPRVDYSVQASGFTVGDLNRDGKVDVIYTSGTPTGTYTITVTATSGALMQTMRLTLTAQ
jgi:hypothetical protein